MEEQNKPQGEGFLANMLHRFGGGNKVEPAAKVIQSPVVDENKFTPQNATSEMKIGGPGLNFGNASDPEPGETITPMAEAPQVPVAPVANKPAA